MSEGRPRNHCASGEGLQNCALVELGWLREQVVDRQLMFVVDDDRRWPDPCLGREVGLRELLIPDEAAHDSEIMSPTITG